MKNTKIFKIRDWLFCAFVITASIIYEFGLDVRNDVESDVYVLLFCLVVNVVIFFLFRYANNAFKEKDIKKAKERVEYAPLTPCMILLIICGDVLPSKESIFVTLVIVSIIIFIYVSRHRWEEYIDKDNVNDKEK